MTQTQLFILSVSFTIAAIFGGSSSLAQQDQQQLVYVKIEVGGLACPFCAYGLEKKIKKRGANRFLDDITVRGVA